MVDFTAERQRHATHEHEITRRKFLRGMGAAALAATYGLTKGVRLNKPPLNLQDRVIDRRIEDAERYTEIDYGVDREGVITLTPEGELLFEPSGEFFTPDREEFRYIHRANSVEAIRVAYNKGADLFDIDVNDVNGVLYAEHGIIPQFGFRVGGLHIESHLPMVIDPDEEEFKLGMPEYTYERLVAYISFLSTDENQLAVSAELKRGPFGLEVMNTLFDIHQRYNVPARVYSREPHRLGL